MCVLLFAFILHNVKGEDCSPCHCEGNTMDCTGAESIPMEFLYHLVSFDRIVIPSHLIDRNLLKLGVVLEPTDTRECTYICTIPEVKSTCYCEVSFHFIALHDCRVYLCIYIYIYIYIILML